VISLRLRIAQSAPNNPPSLKMIEKEPKNLPTSEKSFTNNEDEALFMDQRFANGLLA
jgi:hypothetical protein